MKLASNAIVVVVVIMVVVLAMHVVTFATIPAGKGIAELTDVSCDATGTPDDCVNSCQETCDRSGRSGKDCSAVDSSQKLCEAGYKCPSNMIPITLYGPCCVKRGNCPLLEVDPLTK